MSSLKPTVSEIMNNIQLYPNAASKPTKWIVYQVLMFDEIAIEKRLLWNDKSDSFLGICREHGNSQQCDSRVLTEKELEIVYDALKSRKIHLASELII